MQNLTDNRKVEIKTRNMQELAAYRYELYAHPKLIYLFIELTDCCNLNCRHCGSGCNNRKNQFINTQMLLHSLQTIAEDFDAGKVMVCLSGGEPMLHPDFFEIVEEIVRLGFSWGMTTNGTLVNENNAWRMKEIKLNSVTISIDGTEEQHDWLRRKTGAYQQTIEAIRIFQCN